MKTSPRALSELTIFIDGASRGNPGFASVGVVLKDSAAKTVKNLSVPLGIATNNTAEYCALIFALQEALFLGARRVQVFTDSELVVKQLAGDYKIKEPSLKIFSLLVRHLKQGFEKVEIQHIGREKNKEADREANRALDNTLLF